MGGQSSYFNDVWYSADGSTWTQATVSAGWKARRTFPSVVFNNKMWITGGQDVDGTYKNDVWYSTIPPAVQYLISKRLLRGVWFDAGVKKRQKPTD